MYHNSQTLQSEVCRVRLIEVDAKMNKGKNTWLKSYLVDNANGLGMHRNH